jgi:N-glycosylase/DNA lyase
MTVFEVPLVGPADEPVDLARTLGSHGFAELAPLRPDEAVGTLELTIRPRRGRPRRARVGPGPPGRARVEILGPSAGTRVAADVEAGVRHVLRLDQDLSGFYARAASDPELSWVTSGAGRMLRGPTAFEDVVKTVCTTNCAWSATVRMVNALVTNLGEAAIGAGDPLTNAFPTPGAMAGAPESFYRETVRSGYRGAYLIELATAAASEELDLEALAAAPPEELSDDELEARLLALPGVGPYAAAHIMMTMGRNHRLILDSWTRPAYARLRGRSKLVPDATIRRRYARYGEHAGLAFWLAVTRDWIE